MSEHEFDRYLAILGGLLRLSPKQRNEIANELRDHLEERLRELLNQGMSRSKAIEIALEEFGDTAGLAAEFVNIFRQQRRRRMMRMTAGTVAVVAAVVMISMAMWPEGGAAPARLVAQDDQAGGVPAKQFEQAQRPATPQPLSEVEQNNAAARHKLEQRIDAEFIDSPLKDVLEDIGRSADLQIFVKKTKLEDAGVGLDTPINFSLKRVRIEMVLDLLLEQVELVHMVRDGLVIVTSLDDLDAAAEVRVYNCRDLLHVAESAPFTPRPATYQGVRPSTETGASRQLPPHVLGQFGAAVPKQNPRNYFGNAYQTPAQTQRADQLIEMITTSVDPDSWSEVGGYGTVVEYDGLLVVNHNPRVHRRVEQVLHMLRDAAAKAPGATVRIE